MINKFFYSLFLIAVIFSSGNFVSGQKFNRDFQYIVDSVYAAHPTSTGIIISVITDQNEVWNYAVGISDKKTNSKLNAQQPVLIASNTKPYVSATILKLCELKKLRITDPVKKYLPEKTLQELMLKGYQPDKITIAHLLSHTSGIDDYVNDAYFEFVNNHKQYRWTREEQIARAMNVGKVLGQPGDTFKYADVNYLLLTEVIEKISGHPFYNAMRDLLSYKKLHLNATWFTLLEPQPPHTEKAAHQYWQKFSWDSYDLNPSWDLYGGGGMMATMNDMALFFKYLFERKIITDTNVLSLMYTPVTNKTFNNYCLGIRKLSFNGFTGYYHGGFWGTDVVYFPELKTAIAIAVLEKTQRDIAANITQAILTVITKN